MPALSKGEAEAYQVPKQADHAEGDEALEHGGDNVLYTDHTTVEERKARRHEQNERGGDNHPGGIRLVDGACAGGIREVSPHQHNQLQHCQHGKNHNPAGLGSTHRVF